MELLIGLVLAVLAALIVEEIHANSTSVARWLILRAVRRLPEQERERFHEEWTAHLNDAETVFRKLWHAIGCVCAALRIATAIRRRRRDPLVLAQLKVLKWVLRLRMLPNFARLVALGAPGIQEARRIWSVVGSVIDESRRFLIDARKRNLSDDEAWKELAELEQLGVVFCDFARSGASRINGLDGVRG